MEAARPRVTEEATAAEEMQPEVTGGATAETVAAGVTLPGIGEGKTAAEVSYGDGGDGPEVLAAPAVT